MKTFPIIRDVNSSVLTDSLFCIFEVNVSSMSNKADYYLPCTHTRAGRLNISQATVFLSVFSVANIGVIICP